MRFMMFIKHPTDYEGIDPPQALYAAMAEFVEENAFTGPGSKASRKSAPSRKQPTSWRSKKMPGVRITLSETTDEDLNTLFHFQLDERANYLAAFTSRNPGDRAAYIAKYSKFLTDPTIRMRTIKADGRIVGSIAKFVIEGDAEITYWIGRKFWGQGIATNALEMFLEVERIRPIRARVAFDNYASQRVLEKCGFVKIGSDKGFANARQAEIEEHIYRLEMGKLPS